MKKSILIALLFSLVFLMNGIAELGRGDSPTSNTSNTVEATLLGPKQYIRTTGAPNIYKDEFPGRVGQGMLSIINGKENGDNRISSAIIKINGVQILGPSDFSQNIFKKDIFVSLLENNKISVELRSKPGSFLTIEAKEKIEAEGAAVVKPEGGIVEVINSTSPLYGTKVSFPSGALVTSQLISISLSDFSSELHNILPDNMVAVGTPVEVKPTGLIFSEPVSITLKYYDTDHDGLIDGTHSPVENLRVARINADGTSENLEILSENKMDSTVTFNTDHFTTFLIIDGNWAQIARWEMDGPGGWVEDSQEHDPGLPINPTGQIEWGHLCASLQSQDPYPPCDGGSKDNKSAKIWINPNTEKRVKIRTNLPYSTDNDIYVWHVFVPDMEPNAKVSIGAFLRFTDPSNKEIYSEFDFEIGWGSSYERESVGATENNEVVCFAGIHNSNRTIKLTTNRYHDLDLRLFYASTGWDAHWYVDSIPVNDLSVQPSGPGLLSNYVFCSVEFLNDASKGINPPTRQAAAYFDYVAHYRPCSANLVPNPSFEQGSGLWPDRWERFHYGSGAGNFFWEKNIAKSGTHSAGVTGCNYSDALVWRSTFIPCTLLQRYELRFSYLWSPDSAGDATYYVSCSYYDENFNFLIKWDRFFFNEKNLDWTNIAWTFTPYGRYPIKYLRLEFGLIGRYSSFNATFWIDDVEVRIIK